MVQKKELASVPFAGGVPEAFSRAEFAVPYPGYGAQTPRASSVEDDRAVWNLWVACKVCSYLSAADMLGYLCAVAPGGLAEQQVCVHPCCMLCALFPQKFSFFIFPLELC